MPLLKLNFKLLEILRARSKEIFHFKTASSFSISLEIEDCICCRVGGNHFTSTLLRFRLRPLQRRDV